MKIMPKIMLYTGLVVCLSVAVSKKKDSKHTPLEKPALILKSEAKLDPIPYQDVRKIIILKPVYQEKIIIGLNSENDH